VNVLCVGNLRKLLILKVDQNQLICLTPTIGKWVWNVIVLPSLARCTPSDRPSLRRCLLCFGFSRNRNDIETSNLVETQCWTTVTSGANLRSKGQMSRSLSPWQGSFVPDRLLHSYLRRCVTASSAFCQSSSTTRPWAQSLPCTYGRWAFSVAGPAAWNCLCDELHEPLLSANSFRQLLKTRLFAEYWCIQRIRGITHYALYKSTYLLTYLHWEQKCKNRFCASSSSKVDRFRPSTHHTKTETITGPFYTQRWVYFTSTNASLLWYLSKTIPESRISQRPSGRVGYLLYFLALQHLIANWTLDK